MPCSCWTVTGRHRGHGSDRAALSTIRSASKPFCIADHFKWRWARRKIPLDGKIAALSFCARRSSYLRGGSPDDALECLPRQERDSFVRFRPRVPVRTGSAVELAPDGSRFNEL